MNPGIKLLLNCYRAVTKMQSFARTVAYNSRMYSLPGVRLAIGGGEGKSY